MMPLIVVAACWSHYFGGPEVRSHSRTNGGSGLAGGADCITTDAMVGVINNLVMVTS